jgi:hypoxanthine-guanine phosphoribosyltransferase
MKKTNLAVLIVCLLVGAGVFVSTVMAQGKVDAKQDWSKLKVVTYASGLTGFFDPDTGKLYVYDANMENCVVVRQLVTLGEPMKKLKN